MAGNETIYNVKVKYAMDGDKASKGAGDLAGNLDRAGSSAMSLKGVLAAIGAGAIFKEAKSALIDFNSEIDQMKIGMGTIMQMQLHLPIEKANKEADRLFDTFQQLAKKSPATTKDFMQMAGFIAPAVALAGGNADKIASLTNGAIITSQAVGEAPEMVGRDIQQMLAGTLGIKDRTALQLLGSKGIDYNDFNKMSGQDRAKKTEELLNQDSLKQAADKMGASLKGQVSTFQDMLQIALGQVGRPLMEGITDEVRKWNGWIEKHPKLIKQYVTEFSGMLTNAFDYVKSAAGWFVENKEILFSIAKTFLVFKGAQLGVNVMRDAARTVGGFLDGLSKAKDTLLGSISGAGTAGAMSTLTGVLSGAGGVIPAFLALVPAVMGIVDLFDTTKEDNKKAKEAAMSLQEATGDIPTMLARRDALKFKLGSNNAIYANSRVQDQQELDSVQSKLMDPATLGLALRKIDESSVGHGGSSLKNMDMGQLQRAGQSMATWAPDTFDSNNVAENTRIMKEVESTLKLFNGLSQDQRKEILKNAWSDRWGMPTEAPKAPDSGWGPTKAGDVKITIQKIEVAAEDPDRFVFGLVKIAESATKHPTASQHATPGGF